MDSKINIPLFVRFEGPSWPIVCGTLVGRRIPQIPISIVDAAI